MLSSDDLIIDQNSGIIQLYTEDSSVIGSHMAVITVKLTDYPDVEPASADFTIIIKPQQNNETVTESNDPTDNQQTFSKQKQTYSSVPL